MIKKVLNKKEKEIFDYTIRPCIICCAFIAIIIIGSNTGSISSDTIDGYLSSMAIVMLVNYSNMIYTDLKNITKK